MSTPYPPTPSLFLFPNIIPQSGIPSTIIIAKKVPNIHHVNNKPTETLPQSPVIADNFLTVLLIT